jgi:hypothetical protein
MALYLLKAAPLGCIWPLADYQALLACQEILGKFKRPANTRALI